MEFYCKVKIFTPTPAQGKKVSFMPSELIKSPSKSHFYGGAIPFKIV
jgi:hypothetical protein